MKITYSIKTWSIVALTALLPACSSDDSRQTIDDTPHGPMVFSSTMEWTDGTATGITRVDGQEDYENHDNPFLVSTSRNDHWHVGQTVFFTKSSDVTDSNEGTSYANYARYVYGSNYEFTSTDPLVWKNTTENICAFYRGDMDPGGNTYKRLTQDFAVKQDQHLDIDYQASDFVFFRGDVTYNNGVDWNADGKVKNITFKHKVAQIRLQIFCDDDGFDPNNIDTTCVRIGNQHFYINSTVKANASTLASVGNPSVTTQTELLTPKGTAAANQIYTMTMNHATNGEEGGKKYAEFRLLVIPQTVASDIIDTNGYISRFIEVRYRKTASSPYSWYYYSIYTGKAADTTAGTAAVRDVLKNLKEGKYYTLKITLKTKIDDSSSSYPNYPVVK